MQEAALAVRGAIAAAVEPLSVVFLDVAGVGTVNRTIGHQAGDRLLEAFEDLVRTRLSSSERLWRLGGDEYVVLLPRSARSAARRVRGVRRALARNPLIVTERCWVELSFRAGGATARPGMDTAGDVYGAAAGALRAAKRDDVVLVWAPERPAVANRRRITPLVAAAQSGSAGPGFGAQALGHPFRHQRTPHATQTTEAATVAGRARRRRRAPR